MKRKIIEEAMLQIQERKRKAENDYRNQLKKLEGTEFAELDKKLTKTIIANARKESLGEKSDKREEQELQKQIELLKKKHNVPTKPKYTCEICNDQGIKDGSFCVCLKKEISKQLLKDSGFESLERFDDAIQTSGDLAGIYKKMQEWCNSEFKKNLIFLSGPIGVGKTHLSKCMANELIERGLVVKIVTAFKLNQDFKEFYKNPNGDELNNYLDCDVLFIDDLGTEPKYKNITIEYLYLIINERKMRNLPTIITSNLDLSDIRNEYDERIYSRIAAQNSSIPILINGKDRRITKKI